MVDELAEVRVAGGDDGVDSRVASRVAHQAPELSEDRLHRRVNGSFDALRTDAENM